MSSLANRPSAQFIKGLVLGDSGAGKTGSLESLVRAGYDLRIYDYDNLLDPLASQIEARRSIYGDKYDARLDSIKVQTFTDKMKGVSVPVVMNGGSAKVLPFTDGTPTAFVEGLKQLTHWKTAEEDLGDPAKWGPKSVVVIDTLTTLARAAYRYAQAMNPAAKETQTYYYTAQQLIMQVLSLLCSKQFETNVLVLAHVDYDKNHLDLTKGFPRSIGSALNSHIAAEFNTVLLVETVGSKKVIKTASTGIVDLKNPISHRLPSGDLPIDSGLAAFFQAIHTKE